MTTIENCIRFRPDLRRVRLLLPLAAAALASLALALPTSAATVYWDSNDATAGAGATPNGTWGTDNFWSTSSAGTAATAAWASGNSAVFSAGTDATGIFTVTLSGTQTANSLTFEEGTATLAGGTLTLSGSGGGIVVNAGRVATINSVIAGSVGLLKTAAGELILGGPNTFTGNLTNRAGVITFNHDQSASTGMIVVDNTAAAVLHNSQSLTTLTNSILLRASGSSVDVSADSGTTFVLNGAISGPHPWSSIGLGTVQLGGDSPNTFVGALAVAQGTVVLAKDLALGSTINGTVVSNNATLAFVGGFEYTANEIITLNGNGVGGGAALNNINDDNAFDGTVVLASNSPIGATAGSLGFNGPITGGFNVTKVGAAQVDLFALNNTYNDTLVSQGTLGVWYPSSAGTGSVTVNSGAKLAGNGFVLGSVDLFGTIEPGVGVDTLDTGDQTWQENSHYNWDLSDATGSAGLAPGWDLLNINGGLESLGVSGDPVTIHIRSLDPSFESPADAGNFDNTQDYSWAIATTTGGVDVDLDGFVVDDSGFSNDKGFGTFIVGIANSGNDVVIQFIHPPYITVQPTNQTSECSSGNASFSVGAAGSDSLSYQWNSNGVPMLNGGRFSGVDTATLNITGVLPSDAMTYSCTVSSIYGNTNSAGAVLTVVDTTPPSISCAANQTFECGAAWTFTAPTAGDTCGTPTISILSTVTNPACGNTFVATRTWRATDGGGNFADCSQTITITDTTLPSIVCVGNKTVECGAVWNFDEPTSNDTCGITTNLVVSTVTNSPGCGNTFTATRTWQAIDACGNLSATCSQTVTVQDTTPPVIVCVPDKTVESISAWTFDAPSASDACGSVTISIVSTVTNGMCGNTFVATRTWKATDDCTLQSTNCSQVVTVVDTTPPVVVCPTNKTVECTSAWTFDTPHAADGGLWESVVYDNSVNDMLARFEASTNEVGNEIIIAESARYLTSFSFQYWGTNTSAGGNPPFGGSVVVRLRLYANDGTPYSGYPSPGTVLYDSGNFPVGVTARSVITYDEFDLWVNGLVPLNGAVPTNFTWTVQFSGLGADDQVGVDLFEPPVVGQAYGDYWINTGSGWELRDNNAVEYDFAALASAGTNTVAIAVLNTVTNATCGNAFTATRTWVATDSCGNTNTCSQIVTVVDTTPPSIACPTTVVTNTDAGFCHASGVILGSPVTSDTCGLVTATNDAPALMPKGTNSVIWTAVDACGNWTTCTQTVVVLDLELPSITCPPDLTDVPTDLNLCTASGVILGFPVATNDNCGLLIVTNNAPAVFPHGTTVVQWTVVDTSGNLNVCNQNVTVQDHQSPNITCVANKSVEYTSSWTFDPPSATDNCDIPVISILSTVTNGLCGKTFLATRTWVAVDDSGNSNTCSQVVTVVDTTDPVIVCAPNKSVECTSTWTFDAPHAADGGLWTSIVYDNSVNDVLARFEAGTNQLGNEIIIDESARYLTSFSFQYWGTNSSAGGNPPFGGSVQVRLRLYANDGAPYSGYPSPGTLLYDSGAFPVSVTARSVVTYDEFDLWLNGLVPLSGAVPTNFTWTVQFSGLGPDDKVGVDLFEPPVVGQAYGDYWINTNGNWELQDNIAVEYDFAAQANAGTNTVAITVLSTLTNATCGNTFIAERAWLATDACGNTSTCTQIVTVVDTTAPSITCPATVTVPAALGLCYATNVNLGTPIASDTCSVSVIVSNNAPANFPVGTNTVVWTVVDQCNNLATCNQTVIVEDTQPPILSAGSIAPCYTSAALAEAAAITATTYFENCSVTNISATTLGTCSATVTVTITDASGNSDSVNYATRIDNVAPVIGVVTAEQTQGGGPVNVKDQTCAVAPVLQGVVVFTVVASDDCSLVNGKPAIILTNGVNVVSATCVGTNINTFTYEWTVDNTTANGVWYATVAASDLCNSSTSSFTVCVNQSQITGLLQLEGFLGTGTNVNHARLVTFVMTGGTTVTNSLILTNVSGDTFSYTLVNVPAGTTAVSAKTAWNLREKLAVTFDVNNQAIANFTGNPVDGWSDAVDHYLRGGDLNENNQVSFLDYSILGNNYFTFNLVADITGNGVVNLLDYNILAANWFSAGDPQ